jgi:hypothetical protein
MQEPLRKPTGWVVFLRCLGLFAVACSSEPGNPLIRMLPADHEVEAWVRTESPTLLKTDAELYKLIDGGGPKYIDQGWQGSSYVTYGQAGQIAHVAIHDMGSADNAQAIFNRYLPPSRVALTGIDSAAVDTGLSTAYAGTAFAGRYDIEVSIDERSDAALASVQAFLRAILHHARS